METISAMQEKRRGYWRAHNVRSILFSSSLSLTHKSVSTSTLFSSNCMDSDTVNSYLTYACYPSSDHHILRTVFLYGRYAETFFLHLP